MYSLPENQEAVIGQKCGVSKSIGMVEGKTKVTFMLSPEAKYRLASLKARLRKAGIKETESGIVEWLMSPHILRMVEYDLLGANRKRK